MALSVLVLLITLARDAPAANPAPAFEPGAFPGCQGSGCATRGGFETRAGRPKVHRVTTLADRGPGSLRACAEARGPRVCLFAVSGTIRTSSIEIAHPYVTIDGRTAPGGGIQLTGEGVTPVGEPNMIWIRTHDVVIRGLRMRSGWQDPQSHAILVYPGSRADDPHRIVLDHNSFSFGKDGNVNIAGNDLAVGQPRELTVSFNVVAEALDKNGRESRGEHAASAGDDAMASAMVNLDHHHNLYASNRHRNPLFMGNSMRFVNNVIFNYAREGLIAYCNATIDVVGNLVKPGPANTHRAAFDLLTAAEGGTTACKASSGGAPSVHLAGNKYAGAAVQGWNSGIVAEYGRAQRRAAPMPPPRSGPPIVVEPADDLVDSVLGPLGAGASHRLDCGGRRVPNRDAADVRVAETQWASLPSFSWSGKETVAGWGGYPVVEPAVAANAVCSPASRDNRECACADTDRDGMPDLWEAARCRSTAGCTALGATVAPPWTDLEAFLSGAHEIPDRSAR
jgi:hypothetical protein